MCLSCCISTQLFKINKLISKVEKCGFDFVAPSRLQFEASLGTFSHLVLVCVNMWHRFLSCNADFLCLARHDCSDTVSFCSVYEKRTCYSAFSSKDSLALSVTLLVVLRCLEKSTPLLQSSAKRWCMLIIGIQLTTVWVTHVAAFVVVIYYGCTKWVKWWVGKG